MDKAIVENLLDYYPQCPWMGLLRAIEVDRFRPMADQCATPILDLGCGDGHVAQLCYGKPLAAGVDLFHDILVEAKPRRAYDCIARADAAAVPFPDECFGTVYSNCAMEHMNNLEQVLSEISRILKPDGQLITLVPGDKMRAPIGRIATALGQSTWDAFNRLHNHVNLFSDEQWRERLAQSGLTMEGVIPYGDPEVAAVVSGCDVLSKFHVTRRPPFISLHHGGNLGRTLSRRALPGRDKLQALYEKEVAQSPDGIDGVWRIISARKKLSP